MSMRKMDLEAFKHFMGAYKQQWDLNKYYRTQYDEDLEMYLGYRPGNRYPFAYSEFFNKLLPRSLTILSKMLEQLYQGGTGDLVSVRPRKRQDVERAPRVQGLLNFQLENLNSIDMMGGSYLFNLMWMSNAINWGKGIAKVYWRKEERISPKRIQLPIPKMENGMIVGVDTIDHLMEEKQTVYNAPYAEVLHNKLFVPHPHYKSIQKMPFVFCVYKKPLDYIRKRQKEGTFRNVKEIGWSSREQRSTSGYGMDSYEEFAKSIEIDGALTFDDFSSDRLSPNVDLIEGYGKYIFPEDESSYEVGSGVKIKGIESEAIVHIANYKALLSLEKNKYGFRPFFDIGCYMHPELYWDLGLIRIGKGIQEQYNTLANTRMQNAMMLVNQMLKVNIDADIDPAALVWKPFGLIPVDEMTDVEPLVVPDVSQTQVFREQEQFLESTIADMTGMYAYGMGQTPTRQEHVGTIYSLQSMGEARTKLLLMTMDHTGFRPFLHYMMHLNTFHLPKDFEVKINTSSGQQFVPLFPGDVHPEYDFSARYTSMEPALGKQARMQNLLQLMATWQNSPYLQHLQWMKAIMELMDFQNVDQYLKSEQQLQQEQQQAQQAQLQALMSQQQFQSAESSKKIQGDLIKELIK